MDIVEQFLFGNIQKFFRYPIVPFYPFAVAATDIVTKRRIGIAGRGMLFFIENRVPLGNSKISGRNRLADFFLMAGVADKTVIDAAALPITSAIFGGQNRRGGDHQNQKTHR